MLNLNDILNTFGSIIENNILLAPFIALLSGIIVSFSPCNLSTIPLIIGYIAGTNASYKRSLKVSLSYALGNALMFAILVYISVVFNQFIRLSGDLWYIILGIILIFMVFQLWNIVTIIPSSNLINKNSKKGDIGAFIVGILSGLFSSPCSTPVLVILLTIIGIKGSLLYGFILLLLYSFGHSIIVILAGTSFGLIKKISTHSKYNLTNNIIKTIYGLIILAIAYYMFYMGF